MVRVRRLPNPFYHISKLLLNLLILASLGWLIKVGLDLFSHSPTSQAEAIRNAGIFIGGLVVWLLLISLSRRGVYKYTQPSLKITLLSVAVILIIFGLAGVQPISHYMMRVNEALEIWIGWAMLGLLFNPLYVIMVVAFIIWIIVTTRQNRQGG